MMGLSQTQIELKRVVQPSENYPNAFEIQRLFYKCFLFMLFDLKSFLFYIG